MIVRRHTGSAASSRRGTLASNAGIAARVSDEPTGAFGGDVGDDQLARHGVAEGKERLLCPTRQRYEKGMRPHPNIR